MGSNVEEVTLGGLRLEVRSGAAGMITRELYTLTCFIDKCWDLGGQDSLRETWAAYFTNTDGVVLVVDSSNRMDIPKVQFELRSLLVNQDLLKAPLLILANKQDVKGALVPAELAKELDLNAAEIRRPYHVQGCCALNGEGLHPGFEWLANSILMTKYS
jgi:GTPase SAR1 family protein